MQPTPVQVALIILALLVVLGYRFWRRPLRRAMVRAMGRGTADALWRPRAKHKVVEAASYATTVELDADVATAAALVGLVAARQKAKALEGDRWSLHRMGGEPTIVRLTDRPGGSVLAVERPSCLQGALAFSQVWDRLRESTAESARCDGLTARIVEPGGPGVASA
jgi:hypothetical protein